MATALLRWSVDMCGIAGIVTTSGSPIDRSRLASMMAMLAHRGPNDRGLHSEPAAGLAHVRLSIIDVAGGHQPMSNEDGSLWISFNGEIFNYVELREELVRRGHRFHSKSDTEVLLHLYEEEGERLVEKLNGQWALAIWCRRTQTLFLSRDRLGVRPLFYTHTPQTLTFASEIKALFVDPQVSRELDPCALDNIFTFWTALPPRTPFKSVRALPPGHSLIWRAGRTTVTQYWHPAYSGGNHEADASVDTLRALLDAATKVRMRADVPVGAYLSGGLDSSLIVALMQRASHQRRRTFSIVFDDGEFDERAYQRTLVQALGTEHVEMTCTPEDISRVFPEVVWHAETPLLRTAPAPMFLLSALARDHGCRVVLTGEGADEMFGGYDIFKEAKIRRVWAKYPDSKRRAALVQRLYAYLPELQRTPLRYLQTFFYATAEDLRSPWFSHLPRWHVTSRLKLFLSPQIHDAIADYDGFAEIRASLPADYGRWTDFEQTQYLETAHLLPGYLLSAQGDRMAMAHGVECRYPYLDPEVVAFAATLPSVLKMRALTEKCFLKRAADGLVPAAIRRRTKQPYRSPDGKAFFGSKSAAYVNDLLSPARVARDGVFRPQAVASLVNKFRAGAAVSARDNMALVAIVSTQLLVDRFVNHFETANSWNRSFTTCVHS